MQRCSCLLDRAIDARPDFALTRENAAAVARICRDLDGIPLALELAAARVRSMSVDAIVGHLTDRFTLLKGGDQTALPRQQTLRATIDWSYDLLAPPERALLQRLSVFAGGFALDAAEAVGAGDDVASADVLDALGHLVDKSLVAFDAQNERYRPAGDGAPVRAGAPRRIGRGSDAPATGISSSTSYSPSVRSANSLAAPGHLARPPRRRAREHPARVRPRAPRTRRWLGRPDDGSRAPHVDDAPRSRTLARGGAAGARASGRAAGRPGAMPRIVRRRLHVQRDRPLRRSVRPCAVQRQNRACMRRRTCAGRVAHALRIRGR